MTSDRAVDRLTPDSVDVHNTSITDRWRTIETQQDRRYADEQKRYYLGLRDAFTYFINC